MNLRDFDFSGGRPDHPKLRAPDLGITSSSAAIRTLRKVFARRLISLSEASSPWAFFTCSRRTRRRKSTTSSRRKGVSLYGGKWWLTRTTGTTKRPSYPRGMTPKRLGELVVEANQRFYSLYSRRASAVGSKD